MKMLNFPINFRIGFDLSTDGTKFQIDAKIDESVPLSLDKRKVTVCDLRCCLLSSLLGGFALLCNGG